MSLLERAWRVPEDHPAFAGEFTLTRTGPSALRLEWTAAATAHAPRARLALDADFTPGARVAVLTDERDGGTRVLRGVADLGEV